MVAEAEPGAQPCWQRTEEIPQHTHFWLLGSVTHFPSIPSGPRCSRSPLSHTSSLPCCGGVAWRGDTSWPHSYPHQHTVGPGSSTMVPQPQGPILPPWPELQLLLRSQLSPSGCFCLLLPQAPEPFPHPAPSFSLCPRSTLAVLPYGQSIFPGLSSMLSKRNQIISQAFRLCVQGSRPQA